jgi:PilZ domain
MSVRSAVVEGVPPSHQVNMECRVSSRHECGLQTSCQPIAARGDQDMSWPAEIRDLSTGGAGLVLGRRFERGAGLAIEIPETPEAPGDTLLVQVVHVKALSAGQWLLGCRFVSRLSDDELNRLVALGQKRGASDESDTVVESHPKSFQVRDVTWRGQGAGKLAYRLVNRLQLTGSWPIAPGTILKVWFGKNPKAKVRVRVSRCFERDGRWFVDYAFIDSPQLETLQSFGY